MIIVCVGDCGVDRYVNLGLDRPGGITLNFAVNIRQCVPEGDAVTIVTAVGSDPEAQVVLEALGRTGMAHRTTRIDGATPVQYIDQDPSGEKRFLRYEEGVLSTYRLDAGARELVERSDLLVTNVYRQVEAFFDDVVRISSRGLRFVDFLDLSDYSDDVAFVEGYIERFDIGLFGLSSRDEARIDALERLARGRGKLFIVTLGPGGSVALGGPERISCPAQPVARVVDTTGAGDAFAAGFLASYLHSRDVRASLASGSRQAAAVIQHVGGFRIE